MAAYLVSQVFGWDVMPHAWLRDGPMGEGMVQRWQAVGVAGDALTTEQYDSSDRVGEGMHGQLGRILTGRAKCVRTRFARRALRPVCLAG